MVSFPSYRFPPNTPRNLILQILSTKAKRIQRIIETFATGTTILHAGKSIKHMNFVLPDKITMKNFEKIGENVLTQILSNMREIEKLTQLRDTLLPKLMSGEIDVSKIKL